ncbi:MAG: DUF488 family protein [Candidatus Hydrogenedentes bacterium]|nr:DUF488 family protein [Candidatus Hydrogenedentota bacterium]
MAIFIVQLGSPRRRNEGLRLGTVRRPPRGVPKADWRNYFDLWFPNLSPSAELLRQGLGAQGDRGRAAFRRKFLKEMSAPDRTRELALLAELSHRTNLSVGCYCRDEDHCHRSLLRKLLVDLKADVV